jgi:aminopeptidase-like protein
LFKSLWLNRTELTADASDTAHRLAEAWRQSGLHEGDLVHVRLVNVSLDGEPQLGRRGLYPSLGASKTADKRAEAMLWILSQSDGEHDLLEIAVRSGMPMDFVVAAADDLTRVGLLERAH